MEKLNRAQKCSILGPQNQGPRGAPLDARLELIKSVLHVYVCIEQNQHSTFKDPNWQPL